MAALTHIGASGEARMVDVSDKEATDRVAIAEGRVVMAPATLALILSGDAKKGDVIGAARIAGIMAAKRTHELIPLCHPIALTNVSLELTPDEALPGVIVRAEVKTHGRTGVEMEALTAVAVACLTIYDMAKAVDRAMRIEGVRLIEKRGGKSGLWRAPSPRDDRRRLDFGRRGAGARARFGARAVSRGKRRARRSARANAGARTALLTHPAAFRQFGDGRLRRCARPIRRPRRPGSRQSASRRPDARSLAASRRAKRCGFSPARRCPTAPTRSSCRRRRGARATRSRCKPASRPARTCVARGCDFEEGEAMLAAGRRLTPRDVALAAAANHPTLTVRRRPRVAILATGDELVAPGTARGPAQIVASNNFSVAGIVVAAGGEPIDLGIALDNRNALALSIAAAREAKADVLVTLGGASVGDHDLVQKALIEAGMELGFWRIAMRPGKPLIHGRLGAMRVLGLPGNPTSSTVCALLFLRPLLRALVGDPEAGADPGEPARLAVALGPNAARQDYMRAILARDSDGAFLARPATSQDSSLVKTLARAEALIVRAPHAPAAQAGDPCRVIRFAAHAA